MILVTAAFLIEVWPLISPSWQLCRGWCSPCWDDIWFCGLYLYLSHFFFFLIWVRFRVSTNLEDSCSKGPSCLLIGLSETNMIQSFFQSPGNIWGRDGSSYWSRLLSGLGSAKNAASMTVPVSVAWLVCMAAWGTSVCHLCSWVLTHLRTSSFPDTALQGIFRLKLRAISLTPRTHCSWAKVKGQVPV